MLNLMMVPCAAVGFCSDLCQCLMLHLYPHQGKAGRDGYPVNLICYLSCHSSVQPVTSLLSLYLLFSGYIPTFPTALLGLCFTSLLYLKKLALCFNLCLFPCLFLHLQHLFFISDISCPMRSDSNTKGVVFKHKQA